MIHQSPSAAPSKSLTPRLKSATSRRPLSLAVAVCLAASLVAAAGCDAPIDAFESNRVFAKRLELTEQLDLSERLAESEVILSRLFGSPNAPSWPEVLQAAPELAGLVSLERLQRAAGAVRSDEEGYHFGLFREHCILCHGTSGNGLGATSRLLNPYPRDFRLGKYKFKSTPIGVRPTRVDLVNTLRHGIPGTSMPAFHLLPEDDLQALVDYVIYLSVRGEVERGLLQMAAFELDPTQDAPLVDFSIRESAPQEFAEQWSEVETLVVNVAKRWQAAEPHPWTEAGVSAEAVATAPSDLPLVGQSLDSDAARQQLADSIARGRELFQGKIANCSSCHGLSAAGDGVVNDYDDWTKDWTTSAGLDPNDKSQLKPMLELGALKPRHILPRDLRTGSYRGGSLPSDLFMRIVCGIEGTPMPAAPLQPEIPEGLSSSDVWDLVNYLLSLPQQVSAEPHSAVSEPT